MLRLSARPAFALAATLLFTGCSDPLGPTPFLLPAPAAANQATVASGEPQKCDAAPAAAAGALNMVKGKYMFDIAMERAAQQGVDGMFNAVAKSGCD